MSYRGAELGGGHGAEAEVSDDAWSGMSGWRVCATIAVAARAAALAPALSSMVRRRKLLDRPALGVAATVVTVAELGWLARLIARADSEGIPGVALIDTAGTVGALAVSGQVGDPQVVSAFVVSLVIGSASFQALTVSLPAGIAGSAVSALVATVLANRGKTFSTWEPMVAAAGSFFITARVLRRAVRLNANRLKRAALRRAADRDRLEALRTELAVQHERDAQHRVIHQHALQVLEMVAGDWDLSPESLRAQAARESAYLRNVIDGDDPGAATANLATALDDLVVEFAELGIAVELNVHTGMDEPEPPLCVALVHATREALTNVRKHAGVSSAEVCAHPDGAGGVLVTVVDTGAGFEPVTSRGGLQRDVCEQMAAAGGRADVWSRPGAGTRVELWSQGR